MKTSQEILDYYNNTRAVDPFGFMADDLLTRLDALDIKPFLKPDVTDWEPRSRDPDDIRKEMEQYMPFAWEKANNCRGISACRSLMHFKAWVWLCGDEAHFGDFTDYEHYGKAHLIDICEHYGWSHEQLDNKVRVNSDSE